MVNASLINRLSHAVDQIEERLKQNRPLKVVTVRRGLHEDGNAARERHFAAHPEDRGANVVIFNVSGANVHWSGMMIRTIRLPVQSTPSDKLSPAEIVGPGRKYSDITSTLYLPSTSTAFWILLSRLAESGSTYLFWLMQKTDSPRSLVSLIMCTGGEYRGVRHDRHFSAASPNG
jgi:hypothetical protein